MSGQISTFIPRFWILSVCLSSVVQGEVQVISSSQPIRASVGDDVILPCRCEPEVNAESLTVEWSRTELKPHPSDRLKRVPYVHLYRDQREDLDMKIPEFVNRTQMFPDQLRVGNVSLRIHSVTLADNGTYRCFIPNLRSRSREALISLIVDPGVEAVSPTPEPTQIPKPKDLDPEEPAGRGHWGTLAAPLIVFLGLCVGVMVFVHFKVFVPKLKHNLSRQTSQSENGDTTETITLTMPSAENTSSADHWSQRSSGKAG